MHGTGAYVTFSCTSWPGAHLLLSPVTGRPSGSTCWAAPAACVLAPAAAPGTAAALPFAAWAPLAPDFAAPVAPAWAAPPLDRPAPPAAEPVACSPVPV